MEEFTMTGRKKEYIPEDAAWVIKIRDIAGGVALIGVGILGGFAFINLRPGWAWLRNEDHSESELPSQK